jgi:hypothetical protein
MTAIWKYIISLLFFTAPFASFAQGLYERQVFARVGVDLSRFALPYTTDFGLSGMEFSLDTEIKFHFFPTLEAGFNTINDQTELHTYKMYGNYFRIGVDYNMLKYKHRLDRNLFFVGMRYGNSSFSHQADNITIENDYGTLKTSIAETQISAHWFEGVIGLRGEIVKNLYMGYTIRVKTMIKPSSFENFTPYWVPGYGKGVKNIAIGMSYSLFYAIPLKNPKLDFEK